jgi:hypothetical protein
MTDPNASLQPRATLPRDDAVIRADTTVSLTEAREKRLCVTCRQRPVRRFKPGSPSTVEEKQLRKSVHCAPCIERITTPFVPAAAKLTSDEDDYDDYNGI